MAETVDKDLKTAARGRITELTFDLVRLLNERAAAALVAGEAKVSEGATQVRDLEREREVINTAVVVGAGPFSVDAIARIVQTVMNETSALQSETFGLPLGVPLGEGPGFGSDSITPNIPI